MPTTERYQFFKAQGICPLCEKRPVVLGKARCARCRQLFVERYARYKAKIRQGVLDHYGKVCVCCGESEPEFLTLDHINGGGSAHRYELTGKRGGGLTFYRKLRALGYPSGLRTLCWNCNMARAYHGSCPHNKHLTGA